MDWTGKLSFVLGISRLQNPTPPTGTNPTRMARLGFPDPFGAATDYFVQNHFVDGDDIRVFGSLGNVGDIPVIAMTHAQRLIDVLAAAAAGASKGAKKGGAKKAGAKKAGAKKAGAKKSGAKKKAAKKGAVKKGTAKKAAKKGAAGARGGKKAKPAAKKSAKRVTRKTTKKSSGKGRK